MDFSRSGLHGYTLEHISKARTVSGSLAVVLSTQYSVLSTQYSVLSTRYSVPSLPVKPRVEHRLLPRPGSLMRELLSSPLNWLLVAFPIALVLHWFGAGNLWVFVASGLAIVPLAGLLGEATEGLAETLGPTAGGLLNATFGNAAELLIALMLMAHGPETYPLVKASLTGSIVGNILLVLGVSIVVGGLYHQRQQFNRTYASMGATLLALASIGLVVPTLYYFFYRLNTLPDESEKINSVSEEIAGVLAVIYLLSLVFSLRTGRDLFGKHTEAMAPEQRRPGWGWRTSAIVLLLATAGVAWMSELLVGSVEETGRALGMNSIFMGVIVVSIIGNAAEHSTAVLMAARNKMDLAMHIAIGSAIQIALFVAPVLVFASLVMGLPQPLDLHFTLLETCAVLLSVGVLALVCLDGESNWMEGVMLLGVYVILGIAFYNLPVKNP